MSASTLDEGQGGSQARKGSRMPTFVRNRQRLCKMVAVRRPGRFADIAAAVAFGRLFFSRVTTPDTWHHHAGIAMLTSGDAHRRCAQRTPRLAWTRHPERLVHRASEPHAFPAEFSIGPPDAALGNHEAMVPEALMDRERRTRTGWMGRFDDVRTGRWIQAPWRLPVTMAVAAEHGDAGTVHEAAVDRSWHRIIEGIERRGSSGGLDRAPGGAWKRVARETGRTRRGRAGSRHGPRTRLRNSRRRVPVAVRPRSRIRGVRLPHAPCGSAARR